MAAIKIRAGGSKSASPKPAAKPKATRKRSAKASPKRATATAKKSTPAKRGPGRPRKTAEEKAAPQRRNSTGVDPKVEAKLLKAVKAAGDRRRAAKVEHEESVNALYVVAQEALDAGVSMAKVSDSSDISRQWLYKMGDFRTDERGGNGSPAPKPAAKPKAKATPAKRTTARKSTRTTKRGSATKKTAAKPQRRRIRAAA